MRPSYVDGLKRIQLKGTFSQSPRKTIQSAKPGGRPKIVFSEDPILSVMDVQKLNVGTLKSTKPTMSTTATTPAGSKVSKGLSYFGSKAHSMCPNNLEVPLDLA